MLKKLKTRKILLELLILLSLIFSWSILEGNVRLNYYLETIIGNKIGIAQNFNTIASDINAGKVIIRTYPDKDTLDQISNFPEVEYMSVSTPAYVVQDNLSENDPLKHIKLIGGNQPFPYDLFIEKILLIDGRVFNQQEITQESNVALISENFARKNNLKIGDSYNIKAIGNRFEHEHEHEHEHDSTDHDDIILIPIEIIGIFKANTTSLVSQDSKESQFYTNLL
ncbi:TPA: ABC transporter permease, partial [Streptococcus suis]